MDKATLTGLVLSSIVIAGSMLLGGSIMMFVNVPSIVVVFGGTFAATLITDSFPVVLGAGKVAMNAILEKGTPADEALDVILRLAGVARANGVLALENEEVPPGFMEKALRLLCDGMAPEELSVTLQTEQVSMKSRHDRGVQVFTFMKDTAPSMGMIGTLIGLVQMLQTLDDPSAIGPAMAVALLTTMYGAIIAFLVCGPIADKLVRRTKEELKMMQLVTEGFVSIAKGDNPMVTREKLNSFLAPDVRKKDGE
jgi:chemotaxis protein MotA